MRARYILASTAEQDREGIFAYTYRRSGSVEVARRVDRKLKEEFKRIGRTPTIGHTRADLGIPENLLVRSVYSYLIIYDPVTSPVQILRIWHGAQEKPEIPES
jgi:plasmid stabilization system protein ParE